MKIGDVVKLVKTSIAHTKGVVGYTYRVAEILDREVKLCDVNGEYSFYTAYGNIMSDTVNTTWDKQIETPKEINTVFADDLDIVLKTIGDLLKSKNKAYGNSALKPAKIFSQLDATDSLCSRIDDKLMRIKNRGINDQTEDTVDDLIGYLLLLKMSM